MSIYLPAFVPTYILPSFPRLIYLGSYLSLISSLVLAPVAAQRFQGQLCHSLPYNQYLILCWSIPSAYKYDVNSSHLKTKTSSMLLSSSINHPISLLPSVVKCWIFLLSLIFLLCSSLKLTLIRTTITHLTPLKLLSLGSPTSTSLLSKIVFNLHLTWPVSQFLHSWPPPPSWTLSLVVFQILIHFHLLH